MAICYKCLCNHNRSNIVECAFEKCRGEEYTTIKHTNGSVFLSSTCDNDYDWDHGRIWLGSMVDKCYITSYGGMSGHIFTCDYNGCISILRLITRAQLNFKTRRYRKLIFNKIVDSNASILNDDVLNHIVYSFL